MDNETTERVIKYSFRRGSLPTGKAASALIREELGSRLVPAAGDDGTYAVSDSVQLIGHSLLWVLAFGSVLGSPDGGDDTLGDWLTEQDRQLRSMGGLPLRRDPGLATTLVRLQCGAHTCIPRIHFELPQPLPDLSELVIEDGSGVSNANSYLTVDEADRYFKNRPGGAVWRKADKGAKVSALIRGTRKMDETLRFKGTPAHPMIQPGSGRLRIRDFELSFSRAEKCSSIALGWGGDHVLAASLPRKTLSKGLHFIFEKRAFFPVYERAPTRREMKWSPIFGQRRS